MNPEFSQAQVEFIKRNAEEALVAVLRFQGMMRVVNSPMVRYDLVPSSIEIQDAGNELAAATLQLLFSLRICSTGR